MEEFDYGHWEFPIEFCVDDWFGFIYRVINRTTGQEYIGKKQFFSITRKKVAGRTNRKVVRKESNWKKYTTSSKYINADIKEYGKDNFIFIIESLMKTKAALHYREIEIQVQEDVLRALTENGEKKYYNKCIGGVKFIPPVEHSEETIHKITETHRNKVRNDNSLSLRMSGENNPRYGKSPHENLSPEQLQELKDHLSVKMSGEGNPMHGRNLWAEISEEEAAIRKAKISKATLGKVNSEETRKKMSEAKKGKQESVTCPHCQRTGGKSNMTRYHFSNCKKKQHE